MSAADYEDHYVAAVPENPATAAAARRSMAMQSATRIGLMALGFWAWTSVMHPMPGAQLRSTTAATGSSGQPAAGAQDGDAGLPLPPADGQTPGRPAASGRGAASPRATVVLSVPDADGMARPQTFAVTTTAPDAGKDTVLVLTPVNAEPARDDGDVVSAVTDGAGRPLKGG